MDFIMTEDTAISATLKSTKTFVILRSISKLVILRSKATKNLRQMKQRSLVEPFATIRTISL
ncbi:MAG: hypothetical protein AMJ92_10980 [candidate division Zixibacteria bacterium SM23_81]|nr:MAG: hypothetical protein AMJ92_10980 [candidate division Zixibacteria bacterium SM23_81]